MRTFLNARSASVLAMLLVPTLLAAQELPPRLEAPPRPPPEHQRLQEAQARVEQAQKERRPLQAAPTPPPQQREIEEARQKVRPESAGEQKAPTRDELLQKLRELPGGAERLEQARKRGAPVPAAPPSASALLDAVLEVLAWLNPFHVATANAQTPAFSVALTPANSATQHAAVHYHGASVYAGNPNGRYLFANLGSMASGIAHAQFYVTIPATGWYIVNFTGYGGASKATLSRWTGSTWADVTTWDFSTRYEYLAYPVLLELSAGTHHFIFKPTAGYVYATGLQVYSLQ